MTEFCNGKRRDVYKMTRHDNTSAIRATASSISASVTVNGGASLSVEAFTALDCVQGVSGLPMLKAAMTSMEGEITGSMETGDHIIFLITLTNAVAHREVSEFEPFVHLRKNGFSY